MRYLVLLLLLLPGCATGIKKGVEACAQPSYDANAEYCDSPYKGCDPTNLVLSCTAVHF